MSAALRAVGNIVTGDDIQTQVASLPDLLTLTFHLAGYHQLRRPPLPPPAPVRPQGVHQEGGLDTARLSGRHQ